MVIANDNDYKSPPTTPTLYISNSPSIDYYQTQTSGAQEDQLQKLSKSTIVEKIQNSYKSNFSDDLVACSQRISLKDPVNTA